jgi:cytochrome c peroxidase
MLRVASGLALGTSFIGLAIAMGLASHVGDREPKLGSAVSIGASDRDTSDEPLSSLPADVPRETARTQLGALLFADVRLSEHGRTSCKSCHDLKTNGATHGGFDPGDNGTSLPVDIPTVFNASLSFRRNWEGSPRTMAQLVARTFRVGSLMGVSPDPGLHRLRANALMRDQFRAIYGRKPDEAAVNDALVAFIATLVTPDARFDRWLDGDRQALTATELRGYARFKAVGCAACHQGVNVGGNLLEQQGVFRPVSTTRAALMRVPSLRNVAVTAPYFHNGSARTLPEAVRSMGRAQLDIFLNRTDADDIAAFLRTLTGTYRKQALTQATPGPAR